MKKAWARTNWRIGLLMIAAVLLTAIWPQNSVLAHANLDSSNPVQGAVLPQSPSNIVLHFTEELDPSFSKVQLLDASGNTTVAGPGTIDAGDGRTLRLPVGTLADGIYSAAWQVRSQADGHITQGVVSFSVGVSSPHVSLLPPPGTPDPATPSVPFGDSVARWFSYLAAALTVGSLTFGALIWRMVYRQTTGTEAADKYAARWLRRLARIGIFGLIGATIIFAVVQLSEASGSNLLQAIPLYLATRSGILLLIRIILLVIITAILMRLAPPGAGDVRPWWIAIGLGLAVLLTFSLQSHAEASGNTLAVLLDWMHLMAVSAWIGGLPAFTLVSLHPGLPEPPLSLDKFVPRFSLIALISVDLLAVTGGYSLLLQVQTPDALTQTTYGQTLIIKVGLFAVLVVLGAVNLMLTTRRLKLTSARAANWLRRTVPTEIIIGSLVLLATGILTATSPAYDALQAQRRLGFIETATSDGLTVTLRIAPAQAGDNEFGVDVSDPRPGAGSTPGTVVLRLELLNMNMGITEIDTTTADGLRYTARGTYFPMGGQWQVEVIVRRSGFDDFDHRFLVPVPSPEGVVVVTPSGTQESTLPNPVQPDAASIAAGHTLFLDNCVPCHGVSGKGDGPIGLTLNPRPADLTKHTAPGVHTDGQLYEWITNGYPNSAMPAFGTRLSDTDRWNLVNYIRTLAQPQ